jgi:hypothetical protein
MIKIENGKLCYSKELERDSEFHSCFTTHEKLAEALEDCQLYSCILLVDFLEYELHKNPEYTEKSYYVANSPVDQELAFKNFDSHIEVPFDERIPPLPDDIDDETKHKFKNAVIDGKILLHKYYHIQGELEEITGANRSKRAKLRTEQLYQLCTPTLGTRYARYYHTPEEMSHHFDRNRYMQYFFMSKHGKYDVVCGAGSGSYLREMHGLYSHAFALRNAVLPIKTDVFKLSSKNEWSLLQSFDSFKALGHDLTGNYQPNTKVDFKNIAVYPLQKNYVYYRVVDHCKVFSEY